MLRPKLCGDLFGAVGSTQQVVSNACLGARQEIRCTCLPRPADMEYWDVPPECDACIKWAALNRRLAPLVGLPLHEVHAVPPPSGESFLREPEEARRLALEEALAGRRGKAPA
jgi:hypothetical protein